MILQEKIKEVARSREHLLALCAGMSPEQGAFKPAEGEWSPAEIIEHLVWAEWGGLSGIWKAIEAERKGTPAWAGPSANDGLSIEEIIDRTWQTKEKVPAGAEPKWFGPIDIWVSWLRHGQRSVEDLIPAMRDLNPERIIWPHPISGPMNVLQRMDFLRFHMDRHRQQILRLIGHPDYPEQ